MSSPHNHLIVKNIRRLIVLLFCAGFVVLLLNPRTAKVQTPEKEPIAYTGHGAMFDQKGKEIAPTLRFISEAQAWYEADLSKKLSTPLRSQFTKLKVDTVKNLSLDEQSRLVFNSTLLDWLIERAPVKDNAERNKLRAKNKTMKLYLKNRLTNETDIKSPRSPEKFKPNPQLLERIKASPQLKISKNLVSVLPDSTFHTYSILPAVAEKNENVFWKAGYNLNSYTAVSPNVFDDEVEAAPQVTGAGGSAYRTTCQAAGVPLPPDFGPGSPWVDQGEIPTADLFILSGWGARVLTYDSASPEGMCVALPRYTKSDNVVQLDGIICLGKATSKACFWDNSDEATGTVFNFTLGSARDSDDWGAAPFIPGADTCTDCHAGENPFIIHPGAGTILGQLDDAGLPTFGDTYHDPILNSSWPDPDPMNAPASCVGCHTEGGSGGRFPHLSNALPGFCGTVLANAINRTMPPGAPGSLAGTPEMNALQAWCGEDPGGDGSGRGDPHITTVDGVNYDFQGAGEYIYLRNGGGLEIQVRQTPVSSAGGIPGDSYTGLSSCVSVITAVAARVGKHRITWQPGREKRLELKIDGKPQSRKQITLGDGGSIIQGTVAGGGNDLQIRFPDGTRLIVVSNFWSSHNIWYMNVDVLDAKAREGIMGTITPVSWLPLLPDGTPLGPKPASLNQRYIDLNQKFGEAWRVTDTTSLFEYLPGQSTATFTDRSWPPDKPPCKAPGSSAPPASPIDRQKAMEICRSIKDKNMKAQCMFDVMVTGEAGFGQAYRLTQALIP